MLHQLNKMWLAKITMSYPTRHKKKLKYMLIMTWQIEDVFPNTTNIKLNKQNRRLNKSNFSCCKQGSQHNLQDVLFWLLIFLETCT